MTKKKKKKKERLEWVFAYCSSPALDLNVALKTLRISSPTDSQADSIRKLKTPSYFLLVALSPLTRTR